MLLPVWWLKMQLWWLHVSRANSLCEGQSTLITALRWKKWIATIIQIGYINHLRLDFLFTSISSTSSNTTYGYFLLWWIWNWRQLPQKTPIPLAKQTWSNSECKGIYNFISNSQIQFHLEYTANLVSTGDAVVGHKSMVNGEKANTDYKLLYASESRCLLA